MKQPKPQDRRAWIRGSQPRVNGSVAELPSVKAFEEATRFVKAEDLKKQIPHGPAAEPYVTNIKKWLEAGFDHIVLLSVGPDQESFIRFFAETLAPKLRKL